MANSSFQAYVNSIVDEVNRILIPKYATLAAKEYDRVFKRYTDQWYSSFSPRYYGRSYGMQNYEIESDPAAGRWSLELDEGNFGSNQSSGLVYQIVFEQGYHGGSYGDGAPGGIAYRGPVPFYNHWTRSAVPGFSLADVIDAALYEVDDRLTAEYNAEFKSMLYSML